MLKALNAKLLVAGNKELIRFVKYNPTFFDFPLSVQTKWYQTVNFEHDGITSKELDEFARTNKFSILWTIKTSLSIAFLKFMNLAI